MIKKSLGYMILLGGFGLFVLSGCQEKAENSTTASFDASNQVLVKEKAKEYTNDEYQNGDVRLKTYVKMTGKIVMTDSKNDQEIKKNDRFVIQNDGYDYQVINSSDSVLKLNDTVDVYGEYYGFVKGVEIENNKKIVSN